MPLGRLLYADSFAGPNAGLWPESGVPWAATSNAATVVDLLNDTGRQKTTGTLLGTYNDYALGLLHVPGALDFELYVEHTSVVTSEQFAAISYRRGEAGIAGNLSYPSEGWTLDIQASGSVYLNISEAGTVSNHSTLPSVTVTANVPTCVRVRCAGARHQIKLWQSTAAEPAAWSSEFTDARHHLASGRDYVSVGQKGGNVTGLDALYDNFRLNRWEPGRLYEARRSSFASVGTPAIVQQLGSASTSSANVNTDIVFAGLTKPKVGDTVVVYGSRDNITNDPATGDSITDPAGNTYTRLAMASPPTTSTAAAGLVGVMFYSKLTAVWPAGSNTLRWAHPSVAASAVHAEHWVDLNGVRASTSATAHSTAGAPTVTTGATNPVAGDVVIGMAAFEHSSASTTTGDADTTNGTWSPRTLTVSAGTNLVAAKVCSQRKTVTAGGAQTYNPTNSVTTSVNAVAIVAAFVPLVGEEVAVSGTVNATTSLAGNLTGGTSLLGSATVNTTATVTGALQLASEYTGRILTETGDNLTAENATDFLVTETVSPPALEGTIGTTTTVTGGLVVAIALTNLVAP